MATFTKLKSGSWRAQVRRKGKYVNETFLRRKDAEEWALETERRIDRGEPAMAQRSRDAKTICDLIQLHRDDLQEVGKRIGRSKAASLTLLEHRSGRFRISELDRERIIQFGNARAREGAGSVTLGIDLGYIKTILSHAAAVHGVVLSTEPIALARLGLVGKGNERDRRPTQDELDKLVAAFDANPAQQIPVGRIICFAVATAMRQEEICRIEWPDFDPATRMLLIRDRKDPRKKSGNNQRIPLLDVTGYDAWLSLKSNAPVLGTKSVEFFLIMDGLLARRSGANVVSSKSKIRTFMTSVMKVRAVSSKQGFLLSKSRLRRMAKRLYRRQDDQRAARSFDPPLRHHRDWER